MRDIALTLLVVGLLLATFKHPVIGVYLWAWLSLMNPHKMTFGFAFSMPFAQITAVVALIGLLMARDKVKLRWSGILVLEVLLLLHMSLTSLTAITNPAFVLERWVFVMKIHVMLIVTWMMIADAKQLRMLIWVVALSVGYFGIKGGAWTLMTGGGGRVWGPPGGMLQDNNQLAVGLVMLLPMMYFLQQTETRRWVRRALVGAMVLVTFSILGSQSRGALLALLTCAVLLGLKGKNPWRTTLVVLIVVPLAISMMPASWTERMDTMQTYQQDGSAMSRIWTWHTLWNAALDRPLVGTGFGADTRSVFTAYAPSAPEYDVFQGRVYVAHSIYFQMLGEHGFVGLVLYLLLGLAAWRTASRLSRQALGLPEFETWVPLLMRMVQVSLAAFAVGGAFLSLAYLDLPFYVAGFVVSVDAMMRRRKKAWQSAVDTPRREESAESLRGRTGTLPTNPT